MQIKIILCGAAGKMGLAIIRGLAKADDLELTGAVDLVHTGKDAAELAGLKSHGVKITSDLGGLLTGGIAHTGATVLVDFTSPLSVMENIHQALRHGVPAVVGTTGISDEEINEIKNWVKQYGTGAVIAPTFALGAVLLMKAAQLCAHHMNAAEIIELHHDHKLDAPSGTAIKTAQLIGEITGGTTPPQELHHLETIDKIACVRGGRAYGIPVHSVRLPGLVAHQEVIFGGDGQILTLRHDAINRDCFIPGLIIAIRHAAGLKELIYGMENLI